MGNETININKINILFFNARGFMNAAFYFLRNPNHCGANCNEFSLIVVNGMISAECYLKHIVAYDSSRETNSNNANFPKTHDIDELFNRLSEERQAEIVSELDKIGCNENDFREFRNNTANNKEVVNWRYLSDEGTNYSFDINNMVKIINVLYEISRKIVNKTSSNSSLPIMESPTLDEFSENIIYEDYY